MTLVEVRNRNLSATKQSDTGLLEAVFPQTPPLPAHPGGAYDDSMVVVAMRTLVDGVQDRNPDFQVDLDYGDRGSTTGSPDLATVATGGAGLPGSPYTPAPGSPGAGSINPSDIPEPPENHPGQGSGAGLTTSPSATAGQIANQVGGGPDKNLGAGDSGIMI